jgi:hypothetical protein
MKCTECDGEIDDSIKVRLLIGLSRAYVEEYDDAFPCKACGRLHWPEGAGVSNARTRKKAYWIDKQVISRSLDE